MNRVLLLACAALLSCMAQPLEAQRRDTTTRARRPAATRPNAPKPAPPAEPGDARGVRAEMAAVLLQSRRYDEAAREYRLLVARNPSNTSYRLGLARALAWGKRPREAERELRILRKQRPTDREVETLLRSVRESFEPGVQEAMGWLAERPDYMPYRRALARALLRAGDARSAVQHYDRLLLADSSLAIRREAVYAQVAAGDYERATRLLGYFLRRAPRDTAARHTLAGVLAQAHDYDQALAQYDTLIARGPTHSLLYERAQLHVEQGDLAAAETDVNASVLMRATADGYLLMGDLRRWRGAFAEARSAYTRARLLEPDNIAINTAIARLAREERPIVAFIAPYPDEPGWSFYSSGVGDNLGMTYATLGGRLTAMLGQGFSVSFDVEARRLAEDTTGFNTDYPGIAVGAGFANEFTEGGFIGRLGGRGGVVIHDNAAEFTGAFNATGWFDGWGVALDLAMGPAYPSLLTTAAFRPIDEFGFESAQLLREVSATVALGGPLGVADFAASFQQSAFSDDNQRSTVQAILRFPVTPNLFVLTAASGIRFAQRSSLYWDPIHYIAGLGGIEVASRKSRGLSVAARALAGPAYSVEEVEIDFLEFGEVSQSALQVSGGGEVSYRSEAGEVGGSATYGSGRAGAYRRLEVSLFARLRR
jgi:tetratricopeptide (TPR) repeat protein